ncbi:hypothetical protein EJK17_03170 [Lactobacillus xujianguonis]|uniref:Uncharacterized protein n=2 Tax=Lactobacillaceae TaxID=33958 RepID=A0A437SWM7_9LACO|nr:hypothetical protein EJK17_03170 [Lactobacillus xujianguonis]
MYKFLTIAIFIYVVYYVWREYSKMKKLKQDMDDQPKKMLVSYDKQVSDLRKQLAEVDESISRNQGFPPSFAVNRALKRAKKRQDKLMKQVKQKEAARANYLNLLSSYRAGKIDKSALKRYIDEHQRK